MVRRNTSTLLSASLTASSLCGWMMARISFMTLFPWRDQRHCSGAPSHLQHADFSRVGEHAPGVDDRGHLAQRLELEGLAGGEIPQLTLRDVDVELVAGADLVAEPVRALEGDEIAAVDRVAIEDARVKLGDDALDARGVQGDGGVLARRAAAEILAAD